MEVKALDNMDKKAIIAALPYTDPFLFVDAITDVNSERIEGSYHFAPSCFFYEGHFKNRPVTPGVILTECCAQIGLVSFGMYLLSLEEDSEMSSNTQLAFSSSEMDFLKPVFPNETVRVEAEKGYFRFNKLKSKVKMFNAKNEMVCKGTLSGIMVKRTSE